MIPKLNSVRDYLSAPQRLTGLALLRICLGSVALINLLSHVREFSFLWGSKGMVPFPLFLQELKETHNLSLYALSSSPYFHVALYALEILVVIPVILGWHTRWFVAPFAVLNWSLAYRNWLLLDGGDNLMYLLLFWLVFTDCGARLSLDESAGRSRQPGPLASLVHNMAAFAMIAQVILLYSTSALAKITGGYWQHGTAIYYVLRTGEFNLSHVTPMLWRSGSVVTLLTYSVMAFQVLWPFLVWNRYLKLPLVMGAILMHGAIAYFMGLVWFSSVMIGAEAIIISDHEYERYGQMASRAAAEIFRLFRRYTPLPGTRSLDDTAVVR